VPANPPCSAFILSSLSRRALALNDQPTFSLLSERRASGTSSSESARARALLIFITFCVLTLLLLSLSIISLSLSAFFYNNKSSAVRAADDSH